MRSDNESYDADFYINFMKENNINTIVLNTYTRTIKMQNVVNWILIMMKGNEKKRKNEKVKKNEKAIKKTI